MKKMLRCFAFSLLFVLPLAVGCTPKKQPETMPANDPVAEVGSGTEVIGYTDQIENEIRQTAIIRYDQIPSRVALADQSMTDIMIELGLTDRIVGISNITNPILPKYQAEYDKLTVLGDFSKTAQSVNDLGFPTKEMMIVAEPDMIIGWSGLFYDSAIGTIADWKAKGVNAFVVRNVADMGSPKSLNNNFQDIEDLGQIFHVEDQAAELLAPMRTTISEIQAVVSKADQKVTVLGLGLSNAGTYQVYGKGTLLADLISLAGGEIVETDARGTLTNENLIELNPDFIVYMDYASDIKTDQDGIAFFQGIEALRTMQAVQDQTIIVSPSTRCFNGSLESADEVERFARMFYPELFVDKEN